MSGKAYLAFDLGAESGRAIVGVLENGKLRLTELHRFMHLPRQLPSGLHWNLVDLWANMLQGLREAGKWSREHGIKISTLGVDTWGVDFALVGKSGELMGMPHAYRDGRNAAAMEKTLKTIGKEEIYRVTGCQFMPFNSLYQLVAQYEAEPALVEAAEHLLFVPDLFHFFFTGRAVVEMTNASTSQMVDPRTGKWAKELVERAGVPTRMLGEIVPAGTRIGKVLDRVAEECGVEKGIEVVAPGTHDTASAVAAVPATGEKSWAFISSGTWSLMGAELDAPLVNDAAMAVPFTNEGGVDGTIRFLVNIGGLWLVQECRRYYEKQGTKYDYETLTRLAGEAKAFGTIIDPDHPEFAYPGKMPEKIAEYAKRTGQGAPSEVGEFVRTCLEGLVLTYRRTLEKLEEVLGRRLEVIHIVGGGARNELLNQMTADATGRRVIAGPYEATAIGNVLVQAMGAGDVKDLRELRRIVAASFDPKTYEPRDGEAWEGAYARFKEVVGAG